MSFVSKRYKNFGAETDPTISMIGECSQNQFLSFLLEKFTNICMNDMKRNS